jgi:hypothetical protein
MKYILLLFAALCFNLLFSCTEDKNDQGTLNDDQRRIQDGVLSLQENNYILLTDLQQEIGQKEAVDSVLAAINSDPSVDWAKSNNQGIFIQYKNGIRGGIIFNGAIKNGGYIDRKMDLKSTPLREAENVSGTTNRRKFPVTKSSVYVSPVHDALGQDGEFSLLSTEIYLNATDYHDFKSIINKDASVEWFTGIDKYGIIIISGVGFNTKIDENNTETYLLTGEAVNESTSSKFWSEIKDGKLPLIYIQPGDMSDENYYWISPGFISKYNDLVSDTVFIYGGFSDSNLGNWPGIIGAGNNAFGGYMGYEGAIVYEAHYAWLADFMSNLTDLSIRQSMTCDDWIKGTTISKSF